MTINFMIMDEGKNLTTVTKRGRRPVCLTKNPIKSSSIMLEKQSTILKSKPVKKCKETSTHSLFFPQPILKSEEDNYTTQAYLDAPLTSPHGCYYKYWRPILTSDSESKTHILPKFMSTINMATQTTPLGTGLYWPVPPFVSTRPFTAPVSPTKGSGGVANKKGEAVNYSGPSGPEVWSVIFKRLTKLAFDQSCSQTFKAVLTCARVCKTWYETILKPGREGNWGRMRISSLYALSNPLPSQTTVVLISSAITAFVARCQPVELDLSDTNPSYSTLCYFLRWLPNLRCLNLSRTSGRACILPAFLYTHPAPLWLESLDLSWCSNVDGPAFAKLIKSRPICHRPGFASGPPKLLSPSGADRKSVVYRRGDSKVEKGEVNGDMGGSGSSYLPFKNLQHLSISGTDVFLYQSSSSPPDSFVYHSDLPCDVADKELTPDEKLSMEIGYMMHSNLPNLINLEINYCVGISHHFLIGLSGRSSESEQPKKRSKIEKISFLGIPKKRFDSFNHIFTKKFFPNLKIMCEK